VVEAAESAEVVNQLALMNSGTCKDMLWVEAENARESIKFNAINTV
jgi:hypothetical protein